MTTEPDETRNEVVDFPPPRDADERQRAEWRFGGTGQAGSVQDGAEVPGPQPDPPRPTLRELTAGYAANAVKNPPPPPVKAHDYRDPNERYDELRCRICGRPFRGTEAGDERPDEAHEVASPDCPGRKPEVHFIGYNQTVKGAGDVDNYE